MGVGLVLRGTGRGRRRGNKLIDVCMGYYNI